MEGDALGDVLVHERDLDEVPLADAQLGPGTLPSNVNASTIAARSERHPCVLAAWSVKRVVAAYAGAGPVEVGAMSRIRPACSCGRPGAAAVVGRSAYAIAS